MVKARGKDGVGGGVKEGSMGRERNEGDEDAREKLLPVCGSACSPRLGAERIDARR